MKRFTEYTVFSGLVMAWRFAGSPTLRSPPSTKPTMEGVVFFSLFELLLARYPPLRDTSSLFRGQFL